MRLLPSELQRCVPDAKPADACCSIADVVLVAIVSSKIPVAAPKSEPAYARYERCPRSMNCQLPLPPDKVHSVTGDAGLVTSAMTSVVDVPSRRMARDPADEIDPEQLTLAAAYVGTGVVTGDGVGVGVGVGVGDGDGAAERLADGGGVILGDGECDAVPRELQAVRTTRTIVASTRAEPTRIIACGMLGHRAPRVFYQSH